MGHRLGRQMAQSMLRKNSLAAMDISIDSSVKKGMVGWWDFPLCFSPDSKM